METHRLSVQRTAVYHVLGAESAPREVWFVLHGYAQRAAEFAEGFRALAGEGRWIVAPEGLSRFYKRGSGSRGPGSIGASWMTAAEREHEIDDYVACLDLVLAGVLERTGEVPVTLLGFSQGAATASRWAARGRVDAQRLILCCGGLPPDLTDDDVVRLSEVPIRLWHGETDRWVAPERIAEEEERARTWGLELTLHAFAGGHEVPTAELARYERH